MELNGFASAFLFINVIMVLVLPRRWAPLPLLVGACYMTLAQGVLLGPFHFSIIRILLLSGLVRVIVRHESLRDGMNQLDWAMVAWAIWALISSVFHQDPGAAFIFRLGLVYDVCGIYFLIRIFCQSFSDLRNLSYILAILLIPLAFEMLNEKITLHNLFSYLGGVPERPAIRNGTIRSQGPFAHAILAGTVGAVCLPIFVGSWKRQPKMAVIGLTACLAMIFLCGSSGPIMSAFAGIAALSMWRFRNKLLFFRWIAVIFYCCLDLVMREPAYYILARIDLTGGSTGWHRAALIESAIKYFNEWWLGGTDYTRHWMPTGVSWSEVHTDITNYYIKMGIIGGLPLLILLILIFLTGFSFVGQIIRQANDLSYFERFMVWALGATLFAHATTCISVSYFDQSFIFLYLNLATIASIRSVAITSGQENRISNP